MDTEWQDAVIEALTARPREGMIVLSSRALSIRGWLNFAIGVAAVLIYQRFRR